MRGDPEHPESDSAAQSAALRYGLAVSCVVAGVLLALLLRSVLDASVLLLVAVLLAAWFASLWPALVASAVTAYEPRLGEVSTLIPASRSWASATGELGAKGLGGGRAVPDRRGPARRRSMTRRGRSPPVHGGYTRSRQVVDCNGPNGHHR